jgi:hypothetical protein
MDADPTGSLGPDPLPSDPAFDEIEEEDEDARTRLKVRSGMALGWVLVMILAIVVVVLALVLVPLRPVSESGQYVPVQCRITPSCPSTPPPPLYNGTNGRTVTLQWSTQPSRDVSVVLEGVPGGPENVGTVCDWNATSGTCAFSVLPTTYELEIVPAWSTESVSGVVVDYSFTYFVPYL